MRRGIQVETHAIGDRANRAILDLYEEAFQAVPPNERKVKEPRWRVEHAQILNPTDLPRLAKLGVIASMQPSHAISDLFFAPSRLGEKRLAGAYAWNSLLKSGAIIAAGSDAPVEQGEPMIEFYAAVARKSKDGFTGPGWHPEEAVTREQALKMFTAWPAYAAFQEKDKGSIEAGKLADLTILSADIMKIPAAGYPAHPLPHDCGRRRDRLTTRCRRFALRNARVNSRCMVATQPPAFRRANRLQQRQLRGFGRFQRREAHADAHQAHALAGAGEGFRKQGAIIA